MDFTTQPTPGDGMIAGDSVPLSPHAYFVVLTKPYVGQTMLNIAGRYTAACRLGHQERITLTK